MNFQVRETDGKLEVAMEPLISPSLSIWFGRQGHWSILKRDNQQQYSNNLCKILNDIDSDQRVLTNERQLEKRLGKLCSRIERFINRAFRSDRKCFRLALIALRKSLKTFIILLSEHFADSTTVKRALYVRSLADFERNGEQLIRDQWRDCKSQGSGSNRCKFNSKAL